MLSERIGTLLRDARQQCKLSRKELARRGGVSVRLVAELERGQRPNVSLESALKLLNTVGVSMVATAPTGEAAGIPGRSTAALERDARAARRRESWTWRHIHLHDEGNDPLPGQSKSKRLAAVTQVSKQAYLIASARHRHWTPREASIWPVSKRASGGDSDTFSPDFLDFISCLNERDVAAVLVGGYALGVHGVIRATGDIDFLYRRTKINVRRLCSALTDFGAPSAVIDADALMTPEIVTQFGQPPYRIDLLNTIDGVSFGRVWAGAVRITIQGQPTRVIGLTELRANKIATGRRKDAEDVRKLDARKIRKQR